MRASLALGLAYTALVSAQADGLVSALEGQDDLSTLLQVLGGFPDLVSTLANSSNITILAPTNDAFDDVEDDSVVGQAIAQNNTGIIGGLLNYHVLNGTYNSSQITETPAFIPTLLTNEAFTNVTGGQVVQAVLADGNATFVSGGLSVSMVTEADITVGGITIHKIGSVLSVPSNISTTAINAGLTSAAGALTQAELVDTVDTTPNVTVFVPNNAAFQAVGSAFDDADMETLQSVLQYHVIAGSVVYSTDVMNGSVETLGGSDVMLTVVNGTVFVNEAKVVIANILVANGVVHVIDSVLNPMSNSTSDSTSSASLDPTAAPSPAFSGASSGSEAPFTSGVPEAQSTISVPAVATEPAATGGSGSGDEETSTAGAAKAMATGVVGAGVLFAGAWLGM